MKNKIQTQRLILRQWSEKDMDAFAKLNADPRVMEFFPKLLSSEESNDLANKFFTIINDAGWGLWAAELIDSGEFIGFIGLNEVRFKAHFTPAVEIGWRLAYDYWNKGYATEGAKAVLKFGFENLKLEEIVSFTAVANVRSRHVMEKINMQHDPQEDFDHPNLQVEHPLCRHVLYRIKKDEFVE